MPTANDTYGTAFQGGAAIFLARLLHADDTLVDAAEIDSISYTIYELDPCRENESTPVTGHQGVPLSAGSVIFESLQTGAPWSVDSIGYNFRHDLSVTSNVAFPNAGRLYQIRYEMHPTVGQVIVFRFQIRAI